MELVWTRGGPPRFPYEQFQKERLAYDNGSQQMVWDCKATLRRAAAKVGVEDRSGYTILGHIDAETAKKWKGWQHGTLYALGHRGSLLLCLDCGMVLA